jgi:hypothetical protein
LDSVGSNGLTVFLLQCFLDELEDLGMVKPDEELTKFALSAFLHRVGMLKKVVER